MITFDEFENEHRKWIQKTMNERNGKIPDLAESGKFCYDLINQFSDHYGLEGAGESVEEIMASKTWDNLMMEFLEFQTENKIKDDVFSKDDVNIDTINCLGMFDFFLLGKLITLGNEVRSLRQDLENVEEILGV